MFSPEAGTAVPGRKPGDYFRWLKVCGGCLRVLLRSGRTRAPHGPKGRLRALLGSLVLTQNDAQETLLSGFPRLVAVPEALFSLPAGSRLTRFPPAGKGEEPFSALRQLEEKSGRRFDWDAFLSACERRNRRTRALLCLSERLRRRAGVPLNTASAQAALASLAEELSHRKE